MDFKYVESIKKDLENRLKGELSPAENIIQNVVSVSKGERVLIIANPATSEIAQDLFKATLKAGALATLVFQPDRTSFDNATPEVLAAIATNPDVCFSISNIKLGKDPQGTATPYKTEDGREFSHIFDYLLDGKKTMRAVWTPGITVDMMNRTACIDYKELKNRCESLNKIFTGATSVHVTAPGGTDLIVPVAGRKLMFEIGRAHV